MARGLRNLLRWIAITAFTFTASLSGANALDIGPQPVVGIVLEPWDAYPGYLLAWFDSCWDRQHRTHVIDLIDADSLIDVSSGWATRPSGDPTCMWHNRGGIALHLEGNFATPLVCHAAVAYVVDNVGIQRVALASAMDTYGC